MSAWWKDLSVREQVMVGALSIVVAAFIIYLAIWRPVHGWAEASDLRERTAADALVMVERASVVAPAKRAAAPQATTPLRQAVTQSARIAGIELLTINPEQNGQIEVQPSPVDAALLFDWLTELEFS